MKTFLLLSITSLFVISGLAGCAEGPVGDIPPVSAPAGPLPALKTLRPFRSEQELKNYLKELAEKQKERRRREQQQSGIAGVATDIRGSSKRRAEQARAARMMSLSPTFNTPALTKVASSSCTAIIWWYCVAAACSR